MMNRSSNPVWQQCLAAIEPVLESLSLRLAEERQFYSSFGSESARYERSDICVELFWDGKEHWIDAHYATRDRNQRHIWRERQRLEVAPPPTNVHAHVLSPGAIADEYIANLVAAVRKLATAEA